jgi:hypothetical protein
MIFKAGRLEKSAGGESEMALVNRQTLREMAEDEVFLFRLVACDNQVDRDGERFTEGTLEQLATLYVGQPVLRDHKWSADTQTARVYAASVETEGDVKRLVLRCYMPRTDQTAATIAAIESGILRECSVGCAVERCICSICGADQRQTLCKHAPLKTYEDKVCYMELDGASDAYEVSLVAVPAQPGAGIIKSKRYGGQEPPQVVDLPPEDKKILARARLALEKLRFGG